jgi:hypothetical protein
MKKMDYVNYEYQKGVSCMVRRAVRGELRGNRACSRKSHC